MENGNCSSPERCEHATESSKSSRRLCRDLEERLVAINAPQETIDIARRLAAELAATACQLARLQNQLQQVWNCIKHPLNKMLFRLVRVLAKTTTLEIFS